MIKDHISQGFMVFCAIKKAVLTAFLILPVQIKTLFVRSGFFCLLSFSGFISVLDFLNVLDNDRKIIETFDWQVTELKSDLFYSSIFLV